MTRDLACAVTLLIVAGLYYALARGMGETALSDAVGPAGLPLIYAYVLAAVAVLLGFVTLLRSRRAAANVSTPARGADRESGGPGAAYRLRRAAGTFAIGVGYCAAMPIIGYPFATALAIAAMAVYQHERPSVRLALVAAGGAAALYALFDVVLGVPMPAPWNA